jgi:hypothetical protein
MHRAQRRDSSTGFRGVSSLAPGLGRGRGVTRVDAPVTSRRPISWRSCGVVTVHVFAAEPAHDHDMLPATAVAAAMGRRERERTRGGGNRDVSRVALLPRPLPRSAKRLTLAVVGMCCPPRAVIGAAELRVVPAPAARAEPDRQAVLHHRGTVGPGMGVVVRCTRWQAMSGLAAWWCGRPQRHGQLLVSRTMLLSTRARRSTRRGDGTAPPGAERKEIARIIRRGRARERRSTRCRPDGRSPAGTAL